MKNLIVVLLCLICTVLSSLPAAAQDFSSNIAINVSARVISSIELITIQSMDLSQEKPDNDVIRIAPLTSSNAGKMIAIGTPNSDIRISFLPSRELSRMDGTETLQFHYSVAGSTEDEQSTAEILDQENRDFEFNGDGQFYLWIGGNVDISTAAPGNYQGEFTLEIEYI